MRREVAAPGRASQAKAARRPGSPVIPSSARASGRVSKDRWVEPFAIAAAPLFGMSDKWQLLPLPGMGQRNAPAAGRLPRLYLHDIS